MNAYADTPVPVRPGPLGLRVGSAIDTVEREHLHLPGALAHVDPASPWEPPALTVLDAGLAAEVLDDLWGSGAVDLALADVPGELDPASAGAGLADLHDLGVARWLERWQPYPLDPGLLRLDVLLGMVRCKHLLDVGALGEPEPADLANQAGLADLAQVEELAARVAETLRGGAGATLSPSWAATLGRPRAVAASTPGTPMLRGATTADWDRVPAGTISRAESAVHWEITSTGGGDASTANGAKLHVVTTVAEVGLPHPLGRRLRSPEEVRALRFRLFVEGWPLPVCEGHLEAVGTSLTWAGSVALTPPGVERAYQAGPKELLLDIMRPGLSHPPLTGAPALRARARRWGARGVAAHRLAAVSGDTTLARQARSSARQAAALWTAIGEPSLADTIANAVPEVGSDSPPRPGLAERWALAAEAAR